MLYKQTGLVPPTGSGRIFFEVLSSLALIHGQMRDHFSWLHTDVPNQTVYFNRNNDAHEIVKITPDGIEILKNGGNDDGIILDGSRKMKPIRFLVDADLEEADRMLSTLIYDNMTCAPAERDFILSWLSCFLLIDFAGTRPMTRFEGPAGSGKTTASKLLSALIYGEPRQKKSTDAANYTDGSQNPLIVLDNIEARQMTEDLITFMLTSITGIAKEKRKSGTDTETVIERTKCLLNTTGIEPLGGELSEILSRSFVITFDLANHASDCFLESEVISAIQQNRDLILSAILQRTSHVLAMFWKGALRNVMRLMDRTLPAHGKQRFNDYLSLMYLMIRAGSAEQGIATRLEVLSPQFVEQIRSINATSQQTARESNPIATALNSLFDAYQNAEDLDTKARDGQDDRANHVAGSSNDTLCGSKTATPSNPSRLASCWPHCEAWPRRIAWNLNTVNPRSWPGASATTSRSSWKPGSKSTESSTPTPRTSTTGSERFTAWNRATEWALCLQQAPLEQRLHVTPPIGDHEHIDVIFHDPVDDPVGLEENLTVVPNPNLQQFLWVAPALRVLREAVKRPFDLL